MTETPTFPFDAPADVDQVEESGDHRKLLLLIGAGVVIAALLGYFLVMPLLGGGSPTPSALVPRVSRPRPVPTASAPPRPIPQTFAGVIGRDPFKPLVSPPVVAAAGSGTTSTPGTGTITPSTAPSSAPTTAPSSAPTTKPTTKPTTAPSNAPGMITFKLLSITVNTATVSVNGKSYTSTVGKVYLGSCKLLSTGSVGDGSFLYGDMPIHISEGQTYIFSQ